jgi:hypothetical protein
MNIIIIKIHSFHSWNLREESIKYCNQDTKVLYLILQKFQLKIFELFRIDILKYPTLSSLAFGIYRTHFLTEIKIPLISGEIYNFIKQSYTGGSVDVFKPQPPQNTKIFSYDVNSLKVTNNKRQLIYDTNNKLINTKPIITNK